jgi:hypothetical protein
MNWLWKLTGGRPMTRVQHLFVDRVSGQDVFHYRDRMGRNWMANGAWALYRVERTTDHVIGASAVEAMTRDIYNDWRGLPGWAPWVNGGNSHKQDEARRIARVDLADSEHVSGVEASDKGVTEA